MAPLFLRQAHMSRSVLIGCCMLAYIGGWLALDMAVREVWETASVRMCDVVAVPVFCSWNGQTDTTNCCGSAMWALLVVLCMHTRQSLFDFSGADTMWHGVACRCSAGIFEGGMEAHSCLASNACWDFLLLFSFPVNVTFCCSGLVRTVSSPVHVS